MLSSCRHLSANVPSRARRCSPAPTKLFGGRRAPSCGVFASGTGTLRARYGHVYGQKIYGRALTVRRTGSVSFRFRCPPGARPPKRKNWPFIDPIDRSLISAIQVSHASLTREVWSTRAPAAHLGRSKKGCRQKASGRPSSWLEARRATSSAPTTQSAPPCPRHSASAQWPAERAPQHARVGGLLGVPQGESAARRAAGAFHGPNEPPSSHRRGGR